MRAHGAVLVFIQEPKCSHPKAQHSPSKWADLESRGSSFLTLQIEPQRFRATTTFRGKRKKQTVVMSFMIQMNSFIPLLKVASVPSRSYHSALPSPFSYLFLSLGLPALVQEGHSRVAGEYSPAARPEERAIKVIICLFSV